MVDSRVVGSREGSDRPFGLPQVQESRHRMSDDAKVPDPKRTGAPGEARMIDVSGKESTVRTAVATGILRMRPDVRERVLAGTLEKGDALSTARVAGILAAKRTPDLLPLCHPIRLSAIEVEFEPVAADSIRVRVTVRGTDRTGVEMEALAAVSVAGLSIYDMCKMYGQDMELTDIRLERKSGGKSGDYRRAETK